MKGTADRVSIQGLVDRCDVMSATEGGAGLPKKPLHSSKLMQMKFMQRGVQRKQMQEQSEKQACAAHHSPTNKGEMCGFYTVHIEEYSADKWRVARWHSLT